MGKDMKEKYERVCAIKDKALSLVETQLNGDISQIDAKELGEVVDIAKDMAEIVKYSEEACYYHKVVESMEEASDEEKKYYMDKYIPEYEGKFYTYLPRPIYARQRDSRGRYTYTEPMMMDDDSYRNRMYYSSMGNSNSGGRVDMETRDYREGRSGMTRRTYMEMKENGEDKDKTNKELERYMNELSNDMTEMIQHMDANEKNILKQKITALASRIA